MKRIARNVAFLVMVLLGCECGVAGAIGHSGQAIYGNLCANCHGPNGEGVADKYNEALYGTRSVQSLAGYIHRNMPEDAPDKCRDEEARAVAEYIHGAFYSPEARARLNPPRIELARLTNRQYRESVADLIGSFMRQEPASKPGGLRAEYFQSDGMNKKAKKVISRQDACLDFDFGAESPGEGISSDQFSVAWQGSLMAPDTGFYELRLTTPNGARLYVNMDMRAGDANLRDDSDARRHSALIDLWVSSGGEVRQGATRLFLLGGRSYPLRVDFFKYKEPNAAIRLEWKPPHGTWSAVNSDWLSPENSPAVAVVTTPFPPDDGSLGYERGTAVSKAWQEATTQAATEAANQVIARLATLSGVPDTHPERAARLRQFAVTFTERAFRRPLAEDIKAAYVDRHFEGVANPEVALKRVLLLVLTSPRFLYPDLEIQADSFAVASKLALLLWDSLPDQPLTDSAKRGELLDPVTVQAQARRMAADPRAKVKLREFFLHWLVMEEGNEIKKDAQTYPGFDEAMVSDLRRSLDLFIENVVWASGSDYRELLLADYIYLNERLARFYDLDLPSGTKLPTDNAFVPVTIASGQRAGILTHPYLLATLSYYRSTSPIHRGVFLTRNILGRFLKPPPMAISFMDDRFDPSLTMREKVAELTKSDTCMACHVTINPLGFSLEHFDAVGRWRDTDNKKPVNAASEYTTSEGATVTLRGARDVASHAAENEEARLGFVRHLFHYVVKQPVPAYGSDALERLDAAFVRSNYHVRDLFVEICRLAATPNSKPQQQASR